MLGLVRGDDSRRDSGRDPRGAEAASSAAEGIRLGGRAASESSANAPESEEPDAVDETPEDVEAEEAAADVMLEADAEAEGEGEALAEAEEEADEEALADLEPVDEEEAEAEAGRPRRRVGAAAAVPRRARRGAGRAAGTRSSPSEGESRGERRDVVVGRRRSTCGRQRARRGWCVTTSAERAFEEARAILAHTPRAVARDWSKLLESAVANAENNHELVGEDLYVKAVHADEGPTIKRFRPRAMGRATRIRKRTSHLTILLTPKD